MCSIFFVVAAGSQWFKIQLSLLNFIMWDSSSNCTSWSWNLVGVLYPTRHTAVNTDYLWNFTWPMRSCSCWCGLWRILKCVTALSSSNDTSAISALCRDPLGIGTPLTIMYASPIVSTWNKTQTNIHGLNWISTDSCDSCKNTELTKS